MSSTRMPSNATLEEEELTKRLSEALSTGNEEESVILTRKLCRLSLPVCVSIERLVYPKDQIRLAVGVETAQSETPMPLTVVVSCGMTISQLKDEINKEYGFPHALQHWVIGKCLARDEETLFYYGVRRHGDQAFLFIRSPEDQSPVERQESGENRPPVERQESGENRLEDSQESFTVIPEENESKELYCSKVLPTPPLLPPPPPPPPLHTLPRRQVSNSSGSQPLPLRLKRNTALWSFSVWLGVPQVYVRQRADPTRVRGVRQREAGVLPRPAGLQSLGGGGGPDSAGGSVHVTSHEVSANGHPGRLSNDRKLNLTANDPNIALVSFLQPFSASGKKPRKLIQQPASSNFFKDT
ncbi:uncharacterized protein LOC144075332 isoform X2 [Stigmatopora argus]